MNHDDEDNRDEERPPSSGNEQQLGFDEGSFDESPRRLEPVFEDSETLKSFEDELGNDEDGTFESSLYSTEYDDDAIDYEGHVIGPLFEARIEVTRASADTFGSPVGAMGMMTQKQVLPQCFTSLLETRVHAQCNFSMRLVELTYNKIEGKHSSRSAKEVLVLA